MSPIAEHGPFLRVEEAAGLLRISRTSAYELARRWIESDGREGLPAVRLGRTIRDLDLRIRVTRREQPERVANLLGPRPGRGPEAREWDRAAGYLAQHQATFEIVDGVGPRPQYQHRSAYADSHARVAELLPSSERLGSDLSVELPDLGLSL
jgi:hypothetical protein